MQLDSVRPPVSAAPPPARATTPTLDAPVLIAGGGVAGMTTALELAHQGIASIVLEKRGAVATRQNLFNLLPPVLDNLQRLDPSGTLLSRIAPVSGIRVEDVRRDAPVDRGFATADLAPDPTRSRGDAKALVAAMAPPSADGADNRRWGRIGIAEFENALRDVARRDHSDLIGFRADTAVEGARTVGDHVEVQVRAGGAQGATDTLRGALLVDATAGKLRDGNWKRTGHDVTWVGQRFEGDPDLGTTMRTDIDDAGTHYRSSVELEHPDRSIVWTQLPRDVDPSTLDDAGREQVTDAASETLGVDGAKLPLAPGDRLQARVRLGYNSSAVRGRVLTVGDGSREPYFPTSSGAAMAVVHDAPQAADAIAKVLADPESASSALRSYSMRMSYANRALTASSAARFDQLSGPVEPTVQE